MLSVALQTVAPYNPVIFKVDVVLLPLCLVLVAVAPPVERAVISSLAVVPLESKADAITYLTVSNYEAGKVQIRVSCRSDEEIFSFL